MGVVWKSLFLGAIRVFDEKPIFTICVFSFSPDLVQNNRIFGCACILLIIRWLYDGIIIDTYQKRLPPPSKEEKNRPKRIYLLPNKIKFVAHVVFSWWATCFLCMPQLYYLGYRKGVLFSILEFSVVNISYKFVR